MGNGFIEFWNPDDKQSIEGVLLFFSAGSQAPPAVLLVNNNKYVKVPHEAAQLLRFLRKFEGLQIRLEKVEYGFSVSRASKVA